MSAPSLPRIRLISGFVSLAVNAAALGALLHYSHTSITKRVEPPAIFTLVEIDRTPLRTPPAMRAASRPMTTAPPIIETHAPPLIDEIATAPLSPMEPLRPLPTRAEEDQYARAIWAQVAAHRPRASGARRAARIRFTLNADGTLLDVQLDQSSGDDAFDAACLRAVAAAAPFPKPPPGASDAGLTFVAPIATR